MQSLEIKLQQESVTVRSRVWHLWQLDPQYTAQISPMFVAKILRTVMNENK